MYWKEPKQDNENKNVVNETTNEEITIEFNTKNEIQEEIYEGEIMLENVTE